MVASECIVARARRGAAAENNGAPEPQCGRSSRNGSVSVCHCAVGDGSTACLTAPAVRSAYAVAKSDRSLLLWTANAVTPRAVYIASIDDGDGRCSVWRYASA